MEALRLSLENPRRWLLLRSMLQLVKLCHRRWRHKVKCDVMETIAGVGFMKEYTVNNIISCCTVKKDENWKLHEFSSLVIIRTLVKTIWSLVLENLKFEWNTYGDIIRRSLFMKEQRDVFRSSPWVEKILQRREWLRFPIFLPEQRSLASYSPWGHRETQLTD